MVVPPKHPQMVISSRKTNSCWVPPIKETPIRIHPKLRMETLSSTSPHGKFVASKSSLREFYPPRFHQVLLILAGKQLVEDDRTIGDHQFEALKNGWFFFSLFPHQGDPSRNGLFHSPGLAAPFFLFRGQGCSEVSMVRVGRPRGGKSIHSYPKVCF